jgi:hypothetical protein
LVCPSFRSLLRLGRLPPYNVPSRPVVRLQVELLGNVLAHRPFASGLGISQKHLYSATPLSLPCEEQLKYLTLLLEEQKERVGMPNKQMLRNRDVAATLFGISASQWALKDAPTPQYLSNAWKSLLGLPGTFKPITMARTRLYALIGHQRMQVSGPNFACMAAQSLDAANRRRTDALRLRRGCFCCSLLVACSV